MHSNKKLLILCASVIVAAFSACSKSDGSGNSSAGNSSTYNVVYSGNGNDGGTAPTDSNTYATGATVTVLGNTGTLTKTGQVFQGWNTEANGSGTSRAVGAAFTMGNANVVLYAQWTPALSLTYNGNGSTGGTVPTDSNTYVSGSTPTVLGNSGNLTRTGFGFGLWNTLANGSGANYGPGAVMTAISGNTTLFAKWIANFASITPPEANDWLGVSYINNLFVAVAQSGTNRIMTSADGSSWTARTAPENMVWTSVTYGNGVYVAVGYGGTNRVMTSTDAITWTSRTAAEANAWNSVTYGNGLFVAVAWSGTNRVMTSPDGITWTARSAAAQNDWWGVTYGNNQFVATSLSGTNQVMTSPDGITWTSRTAAQANQWYAVTYGNNLYVAVANSGTNRVMTSPDGITWTARNAAEANMWQSVTFGGGLFAAAAVNGTNRIMTSPDGITWTARAVPEANSWTSSHLEMVTLSRLECRAQIV